MANCMGIVRTHKVSRLSFSCIRHRKRFVDLKSSYRILRGSEEMSKLFYLVRARNYQRSANLWYIIVGDIQTAPLNAISKGFCILYIGSMVYGTFPNSLAACHRDFTLVDISMTPSEIQP